MAVSIQTQQNSFEQALVKLNATVTEAFNRGDIGTCMESYAEGAILLVAGCPPIKGRETIEALLWDYATSGAKLAPVELLDVRSSDDMGYCAGTYEFVVPSSNGSLTRERGQFVTVFVRQADGTWKAVVDSLIGD